MNNTSVFIFGIYQISLHVRDTLHYTAPNKAETFLATQYLNRSESLRRLIGPNTPFAAFLKANEEKAQAISDNINTFLTEIYSDESRALRVVGDLVEVDEKQHLLIYDMTFGIFQTLDDIMRGYIAHSKKEETYEVKMEDAINYNEYFFRAVANYVLVNDLIKYFREYGQAMHEAKGEANPIAQFISEDIKKLISYLNFVDKHNKVKDVVYWESADTVKAFVDQITGKRALPEGKRFDDIFNEVREKTFKTVVDAEAKWQKVFIPLHKEYVQLMNDRMMKNKAEEMN